MRESIERNHNAAAQELPAQSRPIAMATRWIHELLDDSVFKAIALAFAAFIGSKGLDKLPFWGVNRVTQLQPFAEFFGVPVTALLAFTATLQIGIALAFVVAAIRSSRKLLELGVAGFICNMAFFLVGDIGAKAYVKASVLATGGAFRDATLTHLCYVVGALAVFVVVKLVDFFKSRER